MKAQIKFQKILSLITLIAGALVFVFALCFFSGNLADLLFYKNEALATSSSSIARAYEGADDFLYAAQSFVSIMIVLGIVYVCAAAFIYITATNSRRNYYVTNYVAIGIIIAVAAAVALLCLIDGTLLIVEFQNVDFETIDIIRTETWDGVVLKVPNAPEVGDSLISFIFAYIVAVMVIVNAVLWALNLTWKVKLMKGEKELLERSALREAA